MEKRTQELMVMLQSDGCSLEEYLQENQGELLEMPLAQYLQQLLETYQVNKGEVIHRSGLNQIYGYQIFAGSKAPGRDKLLALCFGFPLELTDAQRLLRLGGHSELYPRRRRDSALLLGLREKLTTVEMDDLLYELGEQTLL